MVPKNKYSRCRCRCRCRLFQIVWNPPKPSQPFDDGPTRWNHVSAVTTRNLINSTLLFLGGWTKEEPFLWLCFFPFTLRDFGDPSKKCKGTDQFLWVNWGSRCPWYFDLTIISPLAHHSLGSTILQQSQYLRWLSTLLRFTPPVNYQFDPAIPRGWTICFH